MSVRLALGMLLVGSITPAMAHRLDEYLQATFISVEKDHLIADLFLTPGVAVLPAVLAGIDTDENGIISESEQRAYAERVLQDVSITMNGTPLVPQLMAFDFPSSEQLHDGRGDIHLQFTMKVPGSSATRRFRLENRHQSRLAVYQVNCLATRDPRIRIGVQHRNNLQSTYEVEVLVGQPRPTR